MSIIYRVNGEGTNRPTLVVTNETPNIINSNWRLQFDYSGANPSVEWPATWKQGVGGRLDTTVNGAIAPGGSMSIPMGASSSTKILNVVVNGATATNALGSTQPPIDEMVPSANETFSSADEIFPQVAENFPQANGSSYHSSVIALVAPNITFSGQGVAWPAVAGATSYDVDINDVITNQTHTGIPFDSLGTSPGVKRVLVRARNGNATSNWSNVVRPTVNLEQPRTTLNGTLLSWPAVEGAQLGYEVFIDGGMQPRQAATTFNLSSLPTGVHSINVRALTNTPMSLISNHSDTVGLTIGSSPSTLAAPFIGLTEQGSIDRNIWARARSLQWNPIAGATGYDVSIDGNIVSANQPFTIFWANNLPAGNHTARVRATNGVSASAWSNEITFNPAHEMNSVTANGIPTINNLPTPTLAFGGRTASWNSVSGAVAYEIMINSTSYIQTGTSFTLPNSLPHGPYSIRVRALNNTNALSVWSNVLNLFL